MPSEDFQYEDAHARGDEVAYEPPTAQERRAMDQGEIMPGVSVIHTDMQAPRVELDDGPMPERASAPAPKGTESREARAARMETARQVREAEIKRTTALSLAVQWTATAEEIPLGAVLGIADLMVQYIETGRKPTQTEFSRAVKPFRR